MTEINKINEAFATQRENNFATNRLIDGLTSLGATALLSANNLSDVGNKTTSLDNLNAVAEVSVASASTTNIGAAASSKIVVTGTTTITAFDSAAAGIIRYVRFAGALTLTHNATSLQLQGVNITTAANDRAIFMSLGSGNWALLAYKPATAPVFVTSITAGSGLSGGTITTAGTIALDVNSLTEDTAPDVAADYAPTYDASASAHKKTKLRLFGSLVYLASGSVSSATAVDIVLTSYTAYRSFRIMIDNLVPATSAVDGLIRFSTDGGSSYSSAASYLTVTLGSLTNASTWAAGSTSSTGVPINKIASQRLSSTAADQWCGVIELLHAQSTTLYPQVNFQGQYQSSDAFGMSAGGCGRLKVAQDTDAIRVIMSSGNVASCSWVLYGYA